MTWRDAVHKVHCVGIGGIGISAIARVLLDKGYQITGSDLRLSPVALALRASGAVVYGGHDASHVGDAEVVLISSAIPEDNPEVLEARRRGIPVLKRSEFLGSLMADRIGVAVAGTHGKTTTTSMIVWTLIEAGWDPTFIVGGVIQELNTNASAGQGKHFVVEADEYDRMFLGLCPTVAAITHLEHDHPDCFPTFDDMWDAFKQFVGLVPPHGLIVGCSDHPAVARLLAGSYAASVRTCGLGSRKDWRAEVQVNSLGGHDLTIFYNDREWGRVHLQVPGVHNAQNALVAIAVADWLGVETDTVCWALSSFPGVARRFEVHELPGGLLVVDDYAHHPTKIRATLSAARARYGDRPLWAVFQPHTYSRTRGLWDAFKESFGSADHVVVLPIYAAREKDTLGVSAQALASEIDHPDVRYIDDFKRAAAYIARRAEPGAVVITLSAGDGNLVGEYLTRQQEGRAV